MRSVLLTLLALAFGVAFAGCILVTGGTSGYAVAEGGTVVGGGCMAPSDCSGGQACCLTLNDAGEPAAACQSSCAEPWEQLCAQASDCDDGECFSQTCTVEGVSAQVQTCGPISICVQ